MHVAGINTKILSYQKQTKYTIPSTEDIFFKIYDSTDIVIANTRLKLH